MRSDQTIHFAGYYGDAFDTTWGEFCEANRDCPEDINDAREQLIAKGHATLGGGAAPVYFLSLSADVRNHDRRPLNIALPQGWTWERVEAERAKWGIAENMVPVASVPGACVGWGTINSVRLAVRS